jgi:hypothetical protein
MIPRCGTARRRTGQQQQALAYKQSAPISVGISRAEAKARAIDIEAAVIQAVHDWIWLNRPDTCQLCQGRRQAECHGRPDEMHEEPSRAKTRGLPPWDRFNLRICGRLCRACHQDVTHHRLWIEFADPAAGFMGSVRATPTRPI